MKLLLYCTRAKNKFDRLEIERGDFWYVWYGCPTYTGNERQLNGKIIAECDCDEIELIKLITDDPLGAPFYETNSLDEEELLEKSCLTDDKLYEYLGNNNGYALYLSNLKVFNGPMQLNYFGVKRAPQNMMKVFDLDGNEYILISIRPRHLANILGSKKTIEVRKKILNCMKGLVKDDE